MMKFDSQFSASDLKLASLPGSRLLLLLIGLSVLGIGPWTALAQTTNSSSKLDYSLFKIVTERNIFNAHRSARYRPRAETGLQARVDSFSLVGTMSYEKGTYAFFDGTRSEYRKALKLEDGIAGYKVAAIDPAFVKLASPTNELVLQVGMQLRREENDRWRLSEPSSEPSAASTSETSSGRNAPPGSTASGGRSGADAESATTGTNSGSAAISSGAGGDVLEILRRRREQENN